ncbi:MAG TPA: magnesium/cobalt transporter CorA [Vicinamibacterales bacterium]|nr:magnesium/cobalt transporter CorA [Vicinamibacterales bacterium]
MTTLVERVEREWLDPASPVTLWVDLTAPTDDELKLLSEVFGFHPLSVEDARSALQFPKVEPYPGYLYLVLHGIDLTKGRGQFATRDVDFFLGRNYLVTVHDGESRTIGRLRELCDRHERILSEGAVGLLHRIVDTMVDHYRPAIEGIEERLNKLEDTAFSGQDQIVRQIIRLKRELGVLRRIIVPQRDVVARLARREFAAISDEMAYRFRDVHDQMLRYADEAMLFQERVTGIYEINLSTVSNRLNSVMKVLTVMSTIFLPLTVLTGMWGMNIDLPLFPGGRVAQFWWITAIMVAIIAAMLGLFRRNRWI